MNYEITSVPVGELALPLNISGYIDGFENTIVKILSESFKREDDLEWIGHNKELITFIPDGLLFLSGHRTFMKYRVSVSSYEPTNDTTLNVLKEILKIINHKPIQDDDFNSIEGKYKYFEEITVNGDDPAISIHGHYAYIVPFLHGGYWQNHVI